MNSEKSEPEAGEFRLLLRELCSERVNNWENFDLRLHLDRTYVFLMK
jgi:hypothetical protein